MLLAIYSFFQKQLGQEHAPQNRDQRGLVIGGGLLFLVGFLNGSIASGTGLFATLLLIR